jgi:hypothetical protein
MFSTLKLAITGCFLCPWYCRFCRVFLVEWTKTVCRSGVHTSFVWHWLYLLGLREWWHKKKTSIINYTHIIWICLAFIWPICCICLYYKSLTDFFGSFYTRAAESNLHLYRYCTSWCSRCYGFQHSICHDDTAAVMEIFLA